MAQLLTELSSQLHNNAGSRNRDLGVPTCTNVLTLSSTARRDLYLQLLCSPVTVPLDADQSSSLSHNVSNGRRRRAAVPVFTRLPWSSTATAEEFSSEEVSHSGNVSQDAQDSVPLCRLCSGMASEEVEVYSPINGEVRGQEGRSHKWTTTRPRAAAGAVNCSEFSARR